MTEFLAGIIGFICICFIGLGLVYTEAKYEAAAYNRITNSNVSAWDAMFVELRVQACTK